jgi:methionyl-tRNA formyltransferase
MLMDEGLDTGPIIAQRAAPIRPDHTRGTLMTELAQLGADLLVESLPAWLAGEIKAQPQEDRWATLAPRLRKEEGAIDWTQPADEIERQVRAFSPWPGTFTTGPRGRLKVLDVAVVSDKIDREQRLPGTVFEQDRDIYVVTGQGSLRLITVQPAGKKEMPAEAMVRGQPELLEEQLG